VITFAINAFEAMQVRFSFGGFESEGIGLEIDFATSHYVSIVFNLVRFIIFLIFRPINII